MNRLSAEWRMGDAEFLSEESNRQRKNFKN